MRLLALALGAVAVAVAILANSGLVAGLALGLGVLSILAMEAHHRRR